MAHASIRQSGFVNRALRFVAAYVRLDMIAGITITVALLAYLTLRSS
jgi:hypothetical protein